MVGTDWNSWNCLYLLGPLAASTWLPDKACDCCAHYERHSFRCSCVGRGELGVRAEHPTWWAWAAQGRLCGRGCLCADVWVGKGDRHTLKLWLVASTSIHGTIAHFLNAIWMLFAFIKFLLELLWIFMNVSSKIVWIKQLINHWMGVHRDGLSMALMYGMSSRDMEYSVVNGWPCCDHSGDKGHRPNGLEKKIIISQS